MAVARNSNEIAFQGAPPAAVGEDILYVGIWDAMTGGVFKAGVQVSNDPSILALGEVYYIAASTLVITQTAAANESESMAQDALRGRLNDGGNRFLSQHTDDPGTTGANEGTLARVSVAGSAFAYTDT